MSSVNYNLNNKGVRLIDSKDAWVMTKNGKPKLNPKYKFVGKIDICLPNYILSVVENKKPVYRGDINELNRVAKSEIVKHFLNDKGKRNRKRVAYFGIEKKN